MSIPEGHVRIKRAYESAEASDGARILVDRLWPRGVSKQRADLQDWMKEIAPSTGLRQWFGHDPAKWGEFQRRYREELKGHEALLQELAALAQRQVVTLIYAARDQQHNEAVVLRDVLLGMGDG